MPHLLLEIGTEELPLSSLDVIYSDLRLVAEKVLKQYRFNFKSVKVEATPRRIAIFVEDLSNKQEDQSLELTGPSVEKAYQPNGAPTPALDGFLRSKGATQKQIQIKETPRGKFVAIQKYEKGKPFQSIFGEVLTAIFTGLSFPKQMRWEATGFRFPRPIRWIVVLLDQKPLVWKFSGIRSGALSYGHRFLAPKAFKVYSAEWKLYQKLLKKNHILLSLSERESIIREALKKKYGQKEIDEELVHTNAQLVEEPFLLEGAFSKSYLELPAEVLASCMKKNQKIFACYDTRGKLNGHFVAVLNGKRNGLAKIRSDYENVLESRLKDAQFFYQEDIKQTLEQMTERLNQIVYLGSLGTMLDKTRRLVSLSEHFAAVIGRNDLRDDLKRAAFLSKADLLTQMVYEFPDLQGIAGREYALEHREKEKVAKMIGEQYLPKNLSDHFEELKKKISPEGALLGIVDRIDLLAGAFATGLEPTGSQDPFALRRAAGSVVKLIRAHGFHFSLRETFEAAIHQYVKSGVPMESRTPDQVLKKIMDFFRDRISFELKLKAGSREAEIFEAVWKSANNIEKYCDIADLFERFKSLTELCSQDTETFMKAAKVVERTSNILKGVKEDVSSLHVQMPLLKEPLEKQLYELVEKQAGMINLAFERREYAKATQLFGKTFYRPLNDFFEQIMVNAEDAEVRRNRQALMRSIFDLYACRLADLSVLSRIDAE